MLFFLHWRICRLNWISPENYDRFFFFHKAHGMRQPLSLGRQRLASRLPMLNRRKILLFHFGQNTSGPDEFHFGVPGMFPRELGGRPVSVTPALCRLRPRIGHGQVTFRLRQPRPGQKDIINEFQRPKMSSLSFHNGVSLYHGAGFGACGVNPASGFFSCFAPLNFSTT